MWKPLVGAFCHAYGGRADMAPWTETMGPRWTNYLTNRYDLILAIHVNPTAWDARDELRWLHSGYSEPTMAGGEAARWQTMGERFRPS